jgi:predicted transcriptional regulator
MRIKEGVWMIELTEDEKKVVEAMRSLRAVTEEGKKDVDQIAKTAMLPKGKAAGIVQNLVNKKVVKRIAREKAAGYFVIEQMLV